MTRRLARTLGILALVVGGIWLLHGGPVRSDAPALTWREAVEYGRVQGQTLELNLAVPRTTGEARRPAILIFHGGAWMAGHRRRHNALAKWFAEQGYVAATVSYRFAPAHPWPAQVEDAKCAVRYLRSQADALGIDPNKIGAMGFSAGAHLAMLLGSMDPDDGLHGTGGHATFGSQVNAVVSFFGPSDLASEPKGQLQKVSREAMARVLGPAFRADPSLASPVRYVDRDDAPLLHFQGTRDPLVPYEQGQALVERLREAGMDAEVVFLVGAGHGWGEPRLTDTLEATLRFFDRHLRPRTRPQIGAALRRLR